MSIWQRHEWAQGVRHDFRKEGTGEPSREGAGRNTGLRHSRPGDLFKEQCCEGEGEVDGEVGMENWNFKYSLGLAWKVLTRRPGVKMFSSEEGKSHVLKRELYYHSWKSLAVEVVVGSVQGPAETTAVDLTGGREAGEPVPLWDASWATLQAWATLRDSLSRCLRSLLTSRFPAHHMFHNCPSPALKKKAGES